MSSRVGSGLPRRSWLLGSFACLAAACRPPEERIEFATDRPRPTAEQIDEDPFRLLPPGAVAWWHSNAGLFASDFDDPVVEFFDTWMPFVRGGGIDLRKDVESLSGAVYASVANDVAFVCRGRFDPAAVEGKVAQMPKDAAVTTTQFAGVTLYVSDQVGMAVLTERTLILGTQLGVRRVLELVEEGRVQRSTPEWFDALLLEEAADFQFGMDLDAQPVPAVLRTRLEFLNHLRAARLLGNYRPPGLNLAGTLSFDTPEGGENAAQELNQAARNLERYELLMTALSIPRIIHAIDAKSTGRDTQVAAELDGQAIAQLLQSGSTVLQDFWMTEE